MDGMRSAGLTGLAAILVVLLVMQTAGQAIPETVEAAPVFWRAFLTDLDAWHYEGPEQADLIRAAAGEEKVFAPRLAPGERCSLTLVAPLAPEPRRQYRLTVEMHLAPYTRRRSSVRFELEGGRESVHVLHPARHGPGIGGNEPPPVWVEESANFVTPGDIRGARVRIELEAGGADRGLATAVRAVRIEDLGPVTMADVPGPNLQLNPGLEDGAGSEAFGWPQGVRYENPAAARSGRACARFEGTGRTLFALGGAFLSPPAIVQLRAWVRGAGILIPECRRSGPAYLRMTGLGGPPIELADEWREVIWEVGLPESIPETVAFHFFMDLRRSGDAYMDDVEIRVLSGEKTSQMGEHP